MLAKSVSGRSHLNYGDGTHGQGDHLLLLVRVHVIHRVGVIRLDSRLSLTTHSLIDVFIYVITLNLLIQHL